MQGKQKRLTEERLPPYVSYRAWQKLVSELDSYVPLRFDSSYFDILQMTESNRSMLRGTLLFLGLMSPEGEPTDKLHHLAKAEGEARQRALEGVVREAYEPLFTGLDVTRATQAQIREYFSSQGVSGDIGRKCLSFFFAIAAEANILLSPHLGKSTSRGRLKRTKSDEVPKPKLAKSAQVVGEASLEKMLLDKFPDFDPGWTDEVKAKWFDAFKWLKGTLETPANQAASGQNKDA